VGAYITAVEQGEEALLAGENAKAREAAEEPAAAEAGPAGTSDSTRAEAVPQDAFRAAEGRWGSRDVEITAVRLRGEDGQTAHVFRSGERVVIEMDVAAPRPVEDFVFGVGLFNADGVCCYGTNTDLEEFVSERVEGRGTVSFEIDGLDLTEGTYKIDVAVHRRDGYPYDYHRLLYTFRVKSRTKDVGIYRPPHRWRFSPGVRVRASEE
jgi:hypothetical protein